jgi:hypothetical protein
VSKEEKMSLPDIRKAKIKKRLRMSDAMLIGCGMSNAKEGVYVDTFQGGKVMACAIGSAVIGKNRSVGKARLVVDMMTPFSVRKYTKRSFPFVSAKVSCPVKRCDEMGHFDFADDLTVVGRAEHLFEDHEWSRERIAAWVRKQEDIAIEKAKAKAKASTNG